jgi:hypothetical protein
MTAPNTQAESFYTETADAFTNLAMAATADKDLITTLTTTNVALTCQIATKYWLITNLQAQLRNTNANTNTERLTINTNYCWSHGTGV